MLDLPGGGGSGVVDISAELRVDSLGRVLQGVEMVCLVGFSTHFTTKVVHKGILEGFQISKFDVRFTRGGFGFGDISGELRVDFLKLLYWTALLRKKRILQVAPFGVYLSSPRGVPT